MSPEGARRGDAQGWEVRAHTEYGRLAGGGGRDAALGPPSADHSDDFRYSLSPCDMVLEGVKKRGDKSDGRRFTRW